MANYRYYIRLVFYTGEECVTTSKSRNSTNAIRQALHDIRYEYGRTDVRSLHIKGDPVPVEKGARKRAYKRKAEEDRQQRLSVMTTFPGDDDGE